MDQEADASYTFKDYHGNELSYYEFIQLEDDVKVLCTVVRPDGIVVDPFDYYSEMLYQGAM
jgi:hypothetical protein